MVLLVGMIMIYGAIGSPISYIMILTIGPTMIQYRVAYLRFISQ